ncbi:MAG TPA: AraC family transcriptional regulator, partial [Armatimonadota bacterium]
TPHSHQGMELVYFVEGSGASRIADVTYDFTPGTCLLAEAGVDHDQQNRTAATSLCLVFAHTAAGTLPVRSRDTQGEVRQLCQRILYEVAERRPGYEEICDGVLGQIVGQLRRLVAETQPPTAHPLVNHALDLLRQHHGRISPGELAESLYVSPDYLRHLMREYTARSPIRHALELRLQRACDLLLTSALSIKEIGQRCGFDDQAYFSRLFKKGIGLSPSQYRAAKRH